MQDNYSNITVVLDKNPYQKLLLQYEELVYYLKENGALLNNIRPHYLLQFQDFLCYIKSTSNEYMTNTIRVTESTFSYLSNDAWIQVAF